MNNQNPINEEMLAALRLFDAAIAVNRYNLTKEMQAAIVAARLAIANAEKAKASNES